MPEAVVALGQAKRVVGRLRFESDGRRQHAQFEYDRERLEADDRFRLAPGLPLEAGGFFATGRGDRRNALHICFQDAAPDSWGRALMTRALGGGLTEFEFLTRCPTTARAMVPCVFSTTIWSRCLGYRRPCHGWWNSRD